MVKISKLFIIFCLIFIFSLASSPVRAFSWPWQKKVKNVVDPQLYEVLEKRKLFEEYLKEEGIDWQENIKDLKPEQRKKLLEKAKSIFSLDLKPAPKFEEKDGFYIFTTGMNGNVKGKLPLGIYQVEPETIKDTRIIGPSKIKVFNQEKKRLYLGLKKGKGTKYVKKTVNLDGDKVLNKSSLDLLTDEDLVVQLFGDQNGNGVWDNNEKAIAWAGIKIKLKKTSLFQEFHFEKGLNSVEFEQVPKNFITAAQFLLEMTKAGAGPEWISNGHKMVVLFGVEEYGRDFNLEKDKKYWIFLDSKADLMAVY